MNNENTWILMRILIKIIIGINRITKKNNSKGNGSKRMANTAVKNTELQ